MSDFIIKTGMSVDTVLKNGTEEQKKVAKTFDTDDNGIYNEREASLFNSSSTAIDNENIEINLGKNKVKLSGNYTNYKLKDTGDKTQWDYSLLNTDSKSVIGFDKENKNSSTISVSYNPETKEEIVNIDNYGTGNKILTNTDGLYVSSGNNNQFIFNSSNSRIRTINSTNSDSANITVDNGFGDGYGLSNGEITKKSSHKAVVTNSIKIELNNNDSSAYQQSSRASDDYIFFGKGFLESVANNRN